MTKCKFSTDGKSRKKMIDKFNDMVKGIYCWKVEDGKVVPPKHKFPKAVIERANYFWDMAEDGLSLMGAMKCIFSEIKPDDYDFGATKEWLPMSEEFKEWAGHSQHLAETEMVVYLLYSDKIQYIVTNGQHHFHDFNRKDEEKPILAVPSDDPRADKFAYKFATELEAKKVADEIGWEVMEVTHD